MNKQSRQIEQIITPQPVIEGAGVRLIRSIATKDLNYVDPFLLFDHFGSENPDDYLAGFPMHPHRGIETVTYMLAGSVNHKDTLGNAGSLGAGDAQWMTSGRGIMHEEMPQPVEGKMYGFQLWVNLPAKLKMTEPRYQDVSSDQIPRIVTNDGIEIRIIAGSFNDIMGPVKEIAANPNYLDVSVPINSHFKHDVQRGHTVFAYVFEGSGKLGSENEEVINPKLIVFGDGDFVEINTHNSPIRFLLISGKPLHEPIARYGPFVMNTRDEIEQALRDLRDGSFIQ